MSYSVIIPTRDRPELLHIALRSVLTQTLLPYRVFIIDNSTISALASQTKSLVHKLATSSSFAISYHFLSSCTTASQARSYPLNLIDTIYTAFLDDDDYWHPHKMRIMINKMSMGAQLLSCDSYTVNSNSSSSTLRVVKHTPRLLNTKNSFGGFSNIVVHTSLLHRLLPFNAKLKSCQDWDFYLRASKVAPLAVVPYPLVYYRSDTSVKISTNINHLYSGLRCLYFTHKEILSASPDVSFLLLLYRMRYYRRATPTLFFLLLAKALQTATPLTSILRCLKAATVYLSANNSKSFSYTTL